MCLWQIDIIMCFFIHSALWVCDWFGGKTTASFKYRLITHKGHLIIIAVWSREKLASFFTSVKHTLFNSNNYLNVKSPLEWKDYESVCEISTCDQNYSGNSDLKICQIHRTLIDRKKSCIRSSKNNVFVKGVWFDEGHGEKNSRI